MGMGEICYNCFREKGVHDICPFCGYDGEKDKGKYPDALHTGTVLMGKYIVGRVLGRGGFGVTYLVQDYDTKELYAAKEYFPSLFASRADSCDIIPHTGNGMDNFHHGKELFLEEARTLAEFYGHPNIVTVYSYFEENNTAYFVMEYVPGVDLNGYISSKGGRLSISEANRILLPVMDALQQVHAKGIVHRDVAPDNIRIGQGLSSIKLLDFGAARYSLGQYSMSLDVVVKHGFAPKEQYAKRGRLGPWTDVYAMGATYYYAITGIVPPSAIDLMDEDELVLPSACEGVQIDGKTENALMKALALSARDRYQTMAEFAADLRGVIEFPIEKAFSFLEQGKWSEAEAVLAPLIQENTEFPRAYEGMLMAELHVSKPEKLACCGKSYKNNPYYKKTLECADGTELRRVLEEYCEKNESALQQQDKGKEKKNTPVKTPHRKSNWKIALIVAVVALVGTFTGLVISGAFNAKSSNRDEIVSWNMGGGQSQGSETAVVKEQEPQLVLKMSGVSFNAEPEKEYHWSRLNAKLEPGQDYTLYFDDVIVTEGSTDGVGVKLWNFAVDGDGNALDSVIIDISQKTGNYYCVLHTPDTLREDVDIVLYAGIPGKTKGVGVQYKGISLYKGVFSENEVQPSSNPQLILTEQELTLEANETKQYRFSRLNAELKPNTVYTLFIENVQVNDGSTEGIGVKLWDFTVGEEGKALDAAIIDISSGSGGYSCILSTPVTLGDDADILLYAGVYGKTAGVGVTYKGIRLYEGVYAVN